MAQKWPDVLYDVPTLLIFFLPEKLSVVVHTEGRRPSVRKNITIMLSWISWGFGAVVVALLAAVGAWADLLDRVDSQALTRGVRARLLDAGAAQLLTGVCGQRTCGHLPWTV